MNTFTIIGTCICILYILWNVRKVRTDTSLNDVLDALSTCKSPYAPKATQQIRLYILDFTRQKSHKLSMRRRKIRKLMTKVEDDDHGMRPYSSELHKKLLNYE